MILYLNKFSQVKAFFKNRLFFKFKFNLSNYLYLHFNKIPYLIEVIKQYNVILKNII